MQASIGAGQVSQESDENTQGGQALLSVDDVYIVSVGLLDKDD